ncbi:unnamed protein product, partial [Tetraodon nigroviridis]
QEFISVCVGNPRLVKRDQWRKHVDYEISLHASTNSMCFRKKMSSVRRRYNEFVWLRNSLENNALIMYLPQMYVWMHGMECRRAGRACKLKADERIYFDQYRANKKCSLSSESLRTPRKIRGGARRRSRGRLLVSLWEPRDDGESSPPGTPTVPCHCLTGTSLLLSSTKSAETSISAAGMDDRAWLLYL